MTNRDLLITLLKEKLKKSSNPLDLQTAQIPNDELSRAVFATVLRISNPGFRLSNYGLILFKAHFNSWEFPNPEPLNARKLVTLDRILKFPWFYDDKTFCVFDSDAAVKLRLCDAQLELFFNFFRNIS